MDLSRSEQFRKYLEARGMRLTLERAIIVHEIFRSAEQFDPEQLYFRLGQRTEGIRVSRSTVYRAVMQLEESGLLRKISGTEDRQVYEHD